MTRAGALLPLVALLSACAGRGVPAGEAAGDSLAADSLRGEVQVVGSEPGTQVVLTPAGDGRPAVLAGPQRRVLERLSGLEVAVWGEPEGGTFRVDRFAVRAANGVAAEDGTLVREGSRFLLRTADGRRLEVARLPAALAGRVGARVWIAGPLDGPPDAFGVVQAEP